VLYNNLASFLATFQCPTDQEAKAKLAMDIDLTMREQAPAGWQGDDTREKQVLNALFPPSRRGTALQITRFEALVLACQIKLGEF
jgi:type I restriction enzyme, R subunit